MAQQVTVRPVETPVVTTGESPSATGNGMSPDLVVPKGFSAETWEAITRLWHFLPDYPYEPQHQYFDDRTTDPDYPIEDFSVLTSPEHQSLAHSIYTTLRAWMPDHVRKEQDLRHIGLDSQVQPDIVVAADPIPAGGLLDLDASSPGLLLVVEVLSDTTQAKDRGFKMAFYAALGVQEYWLCNPNALAPSRAEAERRRTRSDYTSGVPNEARIEIYTLNPDGTYDPEPVQPEVDTARYGDWPAYRSPVLGRVVRTWALSPPDHVLQWWDKTLGWRDLETQTKELARSDGHTDGLQQGRLEGLEQGRLEGLEQARRESLESSIAERLKLLAALEPPERDRLAANWRRFGRVPDIMDVLAAHTDLAAPVRPEVPTQIRRRLEFTDP